MAKGGMDHQRTVSFSDQHGRCLTEVFEIERRKRKRRETAEPRAPALLIALSVLICGVILLSGLITAVRRR